MSDLLLPAPLWRRLVAAIYDGLLLIALWMCGTLLDAVVRDVFSIPSHHLSLQILLYLIGLAFFGWFWVHGGQTLGMRVWRLKVRRSDGATLRWPIAAVRYTAAYFSWGAAGLGLLWCLIDSRRRSLHDLAAGTEVVVLPRAG